MATSAILAFNVVNMALRMLGDDSITSAEFTAATLRRAAIANEFWLTTLYATEGEHPWNFNTKRATLLAYTLPAATLTPGAGATVVDTTGVVFTSGVAAFATPDVGRQIVNKAARGKATITGFTDTSHVTATINEAFADLAVIASQSWRLYYAYPAWGFSRSIAVPTDCLRVWRLENNEEYQSEGGFIVVSQDSLNCRYSRQESDLTLAPQPFILALATHLAATMAEPITGQAAKAEHFTKLYEHRLARAKALDGQEGTPEVFESNALIDCR